MPHRTHSRSSRESGYIFLAMMMFLAVMVLLATVAAPQIAHEIKREREAELVHRGVQYARAIRKYYRKFGRYPANIEQLEDTNHLRFLRQRYKDPITREDFQFLRYGQVKLGSPIGIPPVVNLPGAPGVAVPVTAPAGGTTGSQPMPSTGDTGDQSGDQSGAPADATTPPQTQPGDTLTGQTFGGGAIVGVVSKSKDETIREYGGKNHYDKWFFVYDPATDRAGGLISTPQQPLLKGATPLQPNQPGNPGTQPPPANGDLSVQQ
jgi:type II secretory pathway pseudopilin PulG